MPRKLGRLSWRDVLKALEKAGFVYRRAKGDHIFLQHQIDPSRMTTLPQKNEIKTGTLYKILKQAGLTKEEFEKLLD